MVVPVLMSAADSTLATGLVATDWTAPVFTVPRPKPPAARMPAHSTEMVVVPEPPGVVPPPAMPVLASGAVQLSSVPATDTRLKAPVVPSLATAPTPVMVAA